jgi:hypothetical protein
MPKRDRHPKSGTSIHVLPDHVLQRRANAGDDDAWLNLAQREILEAMLTESGCQWSSMEISLGDDRWLHFRKRDGVIKMLLEIDPRMSLDWVKGHWPEIMTWQDRLQASQGPWSTGEEGLLGLELHTRHCRGESYQRLADDLNARIAKTLRSWKAEQAAAQALIYQMGEQAYASVEFDGYGGAELLLRAMGFTDDEITRCCESALKNMAANRPPFLPEEPIDRDRLIARLRAWRARHREWLTQISRD